MSKPATKPEQVAPAALSPAELARRVLRAEADAVMAVIEHLGQSFDDAAALLGRCTGMVMVGGMGKSGLIAQKISATLASTGTPSHFLHPAEAMHGDLGRIRTGDVLILLSYGGQSEEVLALAAVVRQDQVPVISITARPDCHLARISDLSLCVGDVTEACPHNLAPTASTTAMLALGDALALAASAARGFSAEDFAKRHPGGMLGRQMMPITEILRIRAGDNMITVEETVTVGQLIERTSRSGRRPGATIIIDDHQRLSGIFTDADFVKLIAREGPEAMRKPVSEVMTRRPRTLSHKAVVRDAVQMAREFRIDEIPVVDDTGRPVGLVDVQDLVGLKVIEAS